MAPDQDHGDQRQPRRFGRSHRRLYRPALALGFGVASGLGAITGIWGAIAGGLVGGLFGGSHVGVSGPTGPKTVQLATVMHEHTLANGQPDLIFAFGIVFLSGVIMIALALLKVGRFIYLTPYSVISGFMCGIGAIVIIIELNPFLGLPTLSSVREALLAISLFNRLIPVLMRYSSHH